MQHNVTVRGINGAIKWSYHSAAVFNAWTVTRAGAEWTLAGTLVSSDAYRVSQRPLRFVAPHADGQWVWPIEELQIEGASLTAKLGPPVR
jgi:hypothetical protein